MEQEKYNGWTNTATWLALIHIQNDSFKKGNESYYVINELTKTKCYKSIKDFSEKALKLADIKIEFDYHGDFTKEINWEEIFNYYKYDERFPDDEGLLLIESSKDLLRYFKANEENIYLPEFEIDREFYLECKATIESYGYKYKSKKFHKKGANSQKDLDDMINGVEVLSARKEFDFYPTPKKIVLLAQELLEHDENSKILEPSCGVGNLVEGLEKYTEAIEINDNCIESLREKGIRIIGNDFISTTPKKYKYIIMNPPFGKRNDAKHTIEAFNNWLDEGGVLVSITSSGLMNNTDKYSKQFSELYQQYGEHQEIIGAGEFKESGTNIATMISKFRKPYNKSGQISLF